MDIKVINRTLKRLEYGRAMFKVMAENLDETDDARLTLAFKSSIESFELAMEAYKMLKCVYETLEHYSQMQKEEKTV